MKEEFEFKWYKARQCEREVDFGADHATLEYYESYSEGYSLLCPPLRNESDISLRGYASSPIQSTFEM